MKHEIVLNGYTAHNSSNRCLHFGTAESYGIEQINVTAGPGWEDMLIKAVFRPPSGDAVVVLLGEDGVIDVPPEATAVVAGEYNPGLIVFSGVADGVQRISANLAYTVLGHAPVDGKDSEPTQSQWEQLAAQYQSKIDKQQGTENAGKVLGIGEDGLVKPVEVPEVEIPEGGTGLTAEQINALNGMFRICVFTEDASAEYSAFKTAFGITDPGEDGPVVPDKPEKPDEPDEPEVTMTSITATYSGGDVAVGTNVNALTGIVVTAVYSDGTTKVVTDYTLSGTIAEGNNIITVSYGGMTTTFTVVGVSESTEVTLTSISVTYSGGDVAVGTALTDLTGITVTATYSDGSTATVTDYTLSGEIAKGENTITVNYSGLTTTFTVTGIPNDVDTDEMSGYVMPAMPSKWSNDGGWIFGSNGTVLGNLANGKTEGTNSGFVYNKPFTGTVYLRGLVLSTGNYSNKNSYSSYMIVADDADAINSPSYDAMSYLKGEQTELFTVDGAEQQQFIVLTDGTYEQRTGTYVDAKDIPNGYGVISVQKFEIPDGKVGYICTVGINKMYLEGWNAVFFEDVTKNPVATVAEVNG